MTAPPFDFFRTPTDPEPSLTLGMFEDFGFGWNKDTTYGRPRNQALALIEHSENCSNAEAQQKLLQCSLVFLTAGLESFFQFVASRWNVPVPTRQRFGDYEKVAKSRPGYEEIDGKDKTAIVRVFLVRHAIVHYDGRYTTALQKNLNGNVYRSEKIRLGAGNIGKVIEATDRFVESVCRCDETLRALVIV